MSGLTVGRSAALRLFQTPSLFALIALVILAAVLSPTAQDGSRIFFQLGNLTDILRQVSLIGIISLGMTFVILTGGIDLSVGSVLALSTALVATAAHAALAGVDRVRSTCWRPSSLAVLACGAVGALNGLAVARLQGAALHRHPGVDDRGAGLGQMVHRQREHRHRLRPGRGGAIRRHLSRERRRHRQLCDRRGRLFWVLLSKTVFGRHVRAIGDNPTAAVYAGLPIAADADCGSMP